MIVVIVSDSHGKAERMDEILKRYPKADYYIHCGDFLLNQKDYPQFQIVRGNNDEINSFPEQLVLETGKYRLLILHGHQYPSAKRDRQLIKLAKSLNVDVVCFGHTHVPRKEYLDSVLLLNPGALWRCNSRNGPSYAVLEVGDHLCAKICYFNES